MNDIGVISWMPEWVKDRGLAEFMIDRPHGIVPAKEELTTKLRCLRPLANHWGTVAKGLLNARGSLQQMPISQIIAAIDRTAERWCDRRWQRRVTTRDYISSLTGMSSEIVDHSFDLELRNYRRASLEATLSRELMNPQVLDSFREDTFLDGRTMAIGPRITLAIFTGNIPGLPALEIVRALLVKSAIIAKVASGEPIFAGQFVRSLFEVEPRIADAIIVTYWDRQDEETFSQVLNQVDAVIAYGSPDACIAIRDKVPPGKLFVEHGHKVSFGIVSKGYLETLGLGNLASQIAKDTSSFNQHACIAPQAYLIEGTINDVRALGEHVSQAMDVFQKRCPLGQLPHGDAAALQLRRATQEWRSAALELPVWHSQGSPDWTVAINTSITMDSGGSGNRFIRLQPVISMQHAIEILQPFARYLQNVAVGAEGEELSTTCETLAHLGVSRICEPGRMAEPSLMWRHDGRPCVADLVRWCDIEMHERMKEAQPIAYRGPLMQS